MVAFFSRGCKQENWRAESSGSKGRALRAAANLIYHRNALHRLPRRLRGVELPVAVFDAASPLVAGNGGENRETERLTSWVMIASRLVILRCPPFSVTMTNSFNALLSSVFR